MVSYGNLFAFASGQTKASASLAAVRSNAVIITVAADSLFQSPPKARSLRASRPCRSKVAGAVVVRNAAVVAHALVVSRMITSTTTTGFLRRFFSCVEVLFQDKDGRETSLPEAISQQEIRCRHDLRGR